jgi:PAS domain S-box-containing protein
VSTTNEFAPGNPEANPGLPCGMSNAGDSSAVTTAEALRNCPPDGSLPLLVAVIGQIGESVVITDASATIQFVNPAFTRISGYRAEDVVGQNARLLKSGRHDPACYQKLWQTIRSGEVWRGELISQRKDGALYIGETSITPVRDSSGALTNFISITREVTECRATQNALHTSEKRLEDAQSIAPMGSWEVDAGASELCDADGSSRIFSLAPVAGSLPFSNVLSAVHEQDRARVNETLQNTLRTHEPFDVEHRTIRQDGSVRVVRSRGQVVADPLGGTVRLVGTTLDITEGKLAHAELRRSEEKYRTLIANIPDVAWTSDAEGNPIFVSSNSEKVYGFTAQEICTPGFFSSRIHPDHHEKFATAYKAFLEGHAVFDEEFRIQRKDGQWIWVHDRAVATYEKHGKLYTDGMISDITKRKQAEEAFAQERNLLRSLMDNIPDHIYFKDRQSRIIRTNLALSKALGFSDPEQAVGKTDFDFFTAEHAQQAYDDEQKVMKLGEPVMGMEEKETWPDGRVTWASTTKLPLRDSSGEIIGTFGVSRDITERKRAEELLAEERNLLRALIDNMPDWVFVKDLQGRYRAANTAVTHALGFEKPEEMIGKSDFDFSPFSLAARYVADDQRVMTSGQAQISQDEPGVDSATGPRWLSTTKVPLRDGQGNVVGLVAVCRDATERKRVEEQLRLTQHSVDHASDAVLWLNPQGRFVYVNEASCRSLGYSREELLRSSIADVDPSLSNGGWERAWEVLKLRGSVTVETQHRTKQGTAFPVEVNANHLEFDGKEYSIAYARDITERQRVQEQLRKLSLAVEQSPASVIITDVQGNIEYVNPKFTELTGYTAEETIGKNPRVLNSGMQSADTYRGLWTTLLAGDEWRGEFANKKKNGEIYWEAAAIVPIRDSGGIRTHFLAVKEDITDRKRTEEALRDSENRYRQLFERNLAGVFRTALDGRILACNQAAARMFGYDSHEEVLNLPASSLYMTPSEREAILVKLKSEKCFANNEVRYRRKDGAAFWAITSMNLTYGDSGDGTIDGSLVDVTARKHAEEELYQSRHMLQSILDNIPQRVFWKDRNCTYLGCNRAFTKDAGFNDSEEIIGKTDFDLAWMGTAEQYRADDRLVMEQGTAKLNREGSRSKPDGGRAWLLTNKLPLRDAEGNVTGVLGTCDDITDRKQAEDELYQSRQMLQSVLDNIPQGVFWKDRNSIYLGCNQTLAIGLGRNSAAEIVGKSDVDLGLEMADLYRADDRQVMERGIPKLNYDEALRNPDGSLSWLRTNKLPMRDRDGNVIGVLGTYEDVTERRKAEQALAQAEEKYRSLVLNLPDVVWTVAEGGQYAFISPIIEKISGYTLSEIEQYGTRLFIEAIHPDDIRAVLASMEGLFSRDEAYNVECRIRRKSGEWIWVHDRALATYEKNGVRYADGILSEITDRRRAEEALRDSQHFLQSTLDALTSHVAIVNEAGEIVAVNAAWRRFAAANGGNTPTCDVGGNYLEACTSASQKTGEADLAGEGIRRVLAGEVAEFSLEYPCHSPEQKRWFVMRATRFGADGVRRAVLAHENITNRKLAEEAVREGEERFRTMADGCPALMWVTNTDGNNQFINRAYREFCGKDFQHLQEDKWRLLLHPDDAPEYVAAFQRAVREHIPFLAEARIRRADGEWRWVLSHAEPRFSPGGEYMGHVGLSPDITERKKTEQSLQFQNSLIRAIHEVSLDGILVVSDDYLITSHNKKFKQVWQFPLLDIPDNLPDYFVGDQPPLVLSAVLERVKDPVGFVRRVRELYDDPDASDHCEIELKDGRTIERYSSSVRSETGKHLGRVWFFRDITDRKRAEQALQSSEEKFRQLAENVREVFWMMPPAADKMLYASPAYEQIWGRSVESLYKDPMAWTEAIHPDDLQRAHSVFERQMQGEAVESEYRIRTPEGQEKWIRDRAFPIRDQAGQLIRIGGIAEDVTERKQIEEEIRGTSERLGLLLDSIPEAVYGIDMHGNCTFCNPSCLRLLGYDRDTDLHGRDMHDVLHHTRLDGTPYPVEECHIYAAFRQGRGTHIDNEVLWRRDGTSFPAEYWSHPIHRHGQVIGAVVTFVNIAERKQAEQVLRDARQAAEAANQAKSQFLANMSHEIRTPMNGVIGMAGLLLDTELTPEQQQYAEIVRSSGEALLVVINDILDFSRIEARKLVLETIDFDLHVVLSFAAAVLAIKAAEKGLEVTCEIEPGTPRLLRGDPGRVRQVLVNLLGNAVKFTAKGEVAIKVRLEAENERSATLRFTVRDTGIGFRQDQASSLFEPFVQADGSRTRRYGGTGLGLTITKQLVELMGGGIGVESAEGHGSTFWFTAVFEKQRDARPALPEVLPSLREARVMVVDDNTTNRLLVCRLLRSWGCRPEGFGDGKSALAMFRDAARSSDPFQIALLDVTLPVMDGEKLGRLMAADRQSQPMAIVLMAGIGHQSDAARLRAAGFAGCVSKPILHDNLREALLSLSVKGIGIVPAVKHVVPPVKSGRTQRQLRILIAEDNLTNQQVAVAMLKKLGHRTDVVSNGVEALDALRAADYDVVLMDCEMPQMDGYEAARRIRDPRSGTRNPLIPIIALTADAITGDRDKCLQAGMSDYLAKPVDPRRMADALEQWLTCGADGGAGSADLFWRSAAFSCPSERTADLQNRSALPAQVDLLPADVKDVFNADRLLARLMGDNSLARQIVAGFLKDVPQQLLILKSRLDAGDALGARMQAHSLKGAAATVSAEAFFTLCSEAQDAAAAGELTRVRALLPRIEEQLNLLKATLTQSGWI